MHVAATMQNCTSSLFGCIIRLNVRIAGQDADSMDTELNEKREGSFYVWTESEIDEVLGKNSEACDLFKAFYHVRANGNADLSPRR